MLQIISEQGISEYIQNTFADNRPLERYKWTVNWFHKSGGLKKTFVIGAAENPILKVDLELPKKLCGAGEIELAFLDFPVDGDDYITITYDGIIRYRGIVSNSVDPKSGVVELLPYSVRFSETLYNNSFTDKTAAEILQTVIEFVFDDTGITYNSIYVNTGSTDTITIQYEYEQVSKIIDDLVDRLDDRFWGVDVNNIFNLYVDNTTVDQYMFQTANTLFQDIEIKKNYGNIKETRNQVFRKDNAGDTVRAGEVGTGGSYPILPIETIMRKIEKKIVVSDLLTNTEALIYAYAKLIAETEIPLSIEIKGVDLTRYFPVIRHRIKCQDRTERILRTIIPCDTVTGWSGSVAISLDNDDYVEGSGSIYFEAASSVNAVQFDLGVIKRWNDVNKIGFMLKADYAGDYLEFFAYSGESPFIDDVDILINDIDEYIDMYGSTSNVRIPFHIPNGGVWNYYDFDIDIDTFRYFGIRIISDPPASSTIHLDRVQLFLLHRTEYEANVKMAKISIDSSGATCDMTLNKIDSGANDLLFAMNKKIAALEAVNQQ